MNVQADDFLTTADADRSWISDAIGKVRDRWLMVLVIAAGVFLIAVVYLRTTDYAYTATLRVAPAPSASKESSTLGALGGLASIAGIGGTETMPVTPFKLYVEGVYTYEIADRLSRDKKILQHVFKREWDPRLRRFSEPVSTVRGLKKGLFGLLGIPVSPWVAPDAGRLQTYIVDHVTIQQSIKTPLVTISYDDPDRRFAVGFLTSLHKVLDGYLREQALARSAQNIAYISQKLPGVTLVEQRQALFSMLSDQEHRMMLASNPAPFAADPFGTANASLAPTKPRPIPILAAALIIGLLLGVVAALLRKPRQRRLNAVG